MIRSIDQIADDLIQVDFGENIRVDSDYLDTSNYVVIFEGTTTFARVREVLEPKDGSVIATYALLHVDKLAEGTRYEVSFSGLTDEAGTITNGQKSWLSRRTKTDSIKTHIPRHLQMNTLSDMRAILEAISRSDDLIGGARDELLADAITSVGEVCDVVAGVDNVVAATDNIVAGEC